MDGIGGAENRRLVVCGDWNIAHKAIDLKNWRGNQKNSGFLPHERAWLDTLFGDVGYVDAHRALLAPDQAEYTWWSNRGAPMGQQCRVADRLSG